MKTLKTSLNKKDFLSLKDLSKEEILSILDLSKGLKRDLKNGKLSQFLKGITLAMIFQKPSTRTRLSFETGIVQLGGTAIYLSSTDLQLARGESIEDTARTLSLYVDMIMARVYSHSDIEKLAAYSSVPVINGLSDTFHPCQILADLLTIQEHKKTFNGLKIAWIGDGNNVCNDLILGSSKVGMNLSIACPPGFEPNDTVLTVARQESFKSSAEISITDDPLKAIQDADVVATDTFISIGKDEERQQREEIFLPRYQVNYDLLRSAKQDCIFMHCLPASRGREVTSEVIDGKASVVWDQAENRLHVQKALMCMLPLR
ncbi:MAG TPA: ornithine carbamoyltransferase [Nitrososphaeraceae archaeon]|nr:ornithine carbamoyltransferase [Nitrososphaeraceae archaeon]